MPGSSRFRYVLALVLGLVLVAGCSNLVPFSDRLRRDYGIDDETARKLQYYIDGDLLLERAQSCLERSLVNKQTLKGYQNPAAVRADRCARSDILQAVHTAGAGCRDALPGAPKDVKPGSITYDDIAYPYPVAYLPLTVYGQDVRMAYMDVPAAGQPNGRTVVLFHGMNFGGFYFSGPIEALRSAGFRVVVPDQIGF